MSGLGSSTDKGDPKKNILPEVLAKPLTDADADMRTIDELRGVQKVMKEGYENLHEAKLSLNEKATVQACLVELSVMRQNRENDQEQMRRLIGMYQTLQNEFTQFKQQRIRELNLRVNGGSTSREDQRGD